MKKKTKEVEWKSTVWKSASRVPGRGEVLVPALPRKGWCKPGTCKHVCTVTKWCTIDPHTAHYHGSGKKREKR